MLAEALFRITEAARLDGRSHLSTGDLNVLVGKLALASSAFPPDQIIARALELRTKHLGLPSDTADMLGLLETPETPLEMLHLSDEQFRARVAMLESELGEI